MAVVEPLLNYQRTYNELRGESFTAAFQKADPTTYTLQKTFGKFNKISSKNSLFKANNRNTRTKHEIYSKLTINTLGIDFTSWFCIFIVDFEQLIWAVGSFFEVLLLLILNKYFVILVIVFLNCWVRTGKCWKSFHNCRQLLSTRVNVQNVYLTGLAYLDNLLQVTTFFFQCRELVFGFLNGKRNFYQVAIPEPL